jgi:TonB family protein
VSGRFDSGFEGHPCGSGDCSPSYLAWRLRDYTGAPATSDFGTVELLNATALHLVKFDLPKYPPLAKQTRVSGEVRLKISADAQTGLVKDVQLLSGTGVLADPAIEFAKKWQFPPGSLSEQPVEVVLRFDLRCPGE